MKNELKNGTILISKPFIEDSRFSKTIILITEHNSKGTMGFVINKHTTKIISDVLNKKINHIIKNGGPVQLDNLEFIHTKPNIIQGGVHIYDNYYLGGDIEQTFEHIQSNKINKDDISFFLGYAGWEADQLDQEIIDGSWIIYPGEINIFSSELSWSKMLIETDKEHEIWAYAPANFHLN